MKRTKIDMALRGDAARGDILVKGWVRTRRDAKDFSFLEVNDGSCRANIQVVADAGTDGFSFLKDMGVGAAVAVRGELVASPGKGQRWEIRAASLTLIGKADQESYPLQKKRHSDEFLRTIAHLRPRTNKYGALFRIRSEMAFAIHEFFHDRGFAYVHSPILTASDCEGAGEMFRVTSLGPQEGGLPEDERAAKDFFGKDAYLTVSGQLAAEVFACSLGDVYTFGPTFRAEHSDTSRHAAEFWMLEPEMAFADLGDDMDLGEELLKYLTGAVLTRCAADVELFASFVDKDLPARLEGIRDRPFERLPYARAVDILAGCGKTFEYPVGFGLDLQSEHERYLTEVHFNRPVIVYDYPKEIKAFYMRQNDDGKTVAAMDVLVPGIGEIIGGSAREERLDALERRVAERGLTMDGYWWYLDLRRFGSVPHAGFGLGFERLLMLLTGVTNIRDVIPFPRTYRHLEF
ncbi:asparagine--tRNA ligase [Desulfolutivibrio sulfoxidireducens]|uniref:asparagine--tRNA ligase n=1 Tax=Desulfolutivibrio sulfoxidireducens TaxID=2773299 RepID=UPI00159DFDF4|nr:asparagine--tRNA ligase [Desulfolutivibrio sulfoxidireducens]QLA20075.1 asparagine--tRNA ligase [Desulfolutivibrio sulfoxidireducens]